MTSGQDGDPGVLRKRATPDWPVRCVSCNLRYLKGYVYRFTTRTSTGWWCHRCMVTLANSPHA